MGKLDWLGIAGLMFTVGTAVLAVVKKLWYNDVMLEIQANRQRIALLEQWRDNHDKVVVPGLVEDFEEHLNGFGVRVEGVSNTAAGNSRDLQAHAQQLTEIRGQLATAQRDIGRAEESVKSEKAERSAGLYECRGDVKSHGERLAGVEAQTELVKRLLESLGHQMQQALVNGLRRDSQGG